MRASLQQSKLDNNDMEVNKGAAGREMSEHLDALIEEARRLPWTESRAQAVSFAYGNLALHNPAITRTMVEEAFNQLYGSQ